MYDLPSPSSSLSCVGFSGKGAPLEYWGGGGLEIFGNKISIFVGEMGEINGHN